MSKETLHHLIALEQTSLNSMKELLDTRRREGGPIERLLGFIEASQIALHNLYDKLAELEGR